MFRKLCDEFFPRPDLFDRQHGTKTSGHSCLPWTRVLHGKRDETCRYQGIDPALFSAAVKDLPRWPFIDLGCGRGRALILAQEAGFTDLAGVEFSPALCRCTRANLAKTNTDAKIICGDARDYAFPANPSVVFMYNPFGESIMRTVFANMQGHPRIVVYVNPKQAHVFRPFHVLRSDENTVIFSDSDKGGDLEGGGLG
jgi:SAM-dependent methyltransferase